MKDIFLLFNYFKPFKYIFKNMLHIQNYKMVYKIEFYKRK